jgi:hypothetical protein
MLRNVSFSKHTIMRLRYRCYEYPSNGLLCI